MLTATDSSIIHIGDAVSVTPLAHCWSALKSDIGTRVNSRIR